MPGSCIYHKHCERFFKQIQADMGEDNEFSPAYVRNKTNLNGVVTEQRVTEILDEKLSDILRVLGDPDNYQSLSITLLENLMFQYGVNVVATLVNVPVTKQSVEATVGTNETLSLAAAMKVGQLINIKVKATGNITITIPSTSGWEIMNDEDTFDLVTNQLAEINIWCTGNGQYLVKVSVKE